MEGDEDEGEEGGGWDVDDDLVLPPDLVMAKNIHVHVVLTCACT